MALSIDEQELHINANRDEDFAIAYCSDRTWITKMDKLVAKSPDLFVVVAETEHGKTYRFPKRLISIRRSVVSRTMSDEQRQAAADRLRNLHKRNSKS
nr:MAG TPA: hypothetical protein [Caudoviricetes sp.]